MQLPISQRYKPLETKKQVFEHKKSRRRLNLRLVDLRSVAISTSEPYVVANCTLSNRALNCIRACSILRVVSGRGRLLPFR